ncbi:MAG: tetratricopeptide repeat protein [Deltaproteobacteria bacterium]|nr:tetratricopeptide repeat protein [Deltaproteobacteria bacterium]
MHILRQGLAALGPDEELALCLTVSLMKARAYEEAMALLAEYPDSAEAARYMANCWRALGDFDRAARHMDRYHRLAETAPQRQRGTP